MSRRAALEKKFPRLRGIRWDIKSRPTRRYNCIAWGASERHRRWDYGPSDFWPKGVAKKDGIAYLVAAYVAVGFEVCSKGECEKYDQEYNSVVLYELNGEWSHAARLVANGMWSSKLGDYVDIQHETPDALSGIQYGDPIVYLRRERRRRGKKTST